MKTRKEFGLILIVIFSVAAIITLNLLLVYFEKQSPDANIKNVSDAFWYMIITLTTVGYGDFFPVTTQGKFIGYFFVFGSLGVLGYLISTLTAKIYRYMEDRKLGFHGTDFEDHILFVGWNEFSQLVAEEIYHTEKKMAIVTPRRDDIEIIYNKFKKENVFVLFAEINNLEILEKVNASKASAVFISIPDDAQILLYVLDFKKKYPKPDIVVSIENSKLKGTFKAAGVTYAIARNEIASKLVASYIFEPDVANLSYDLLSSSRSDFDYDMLEYKILEKNPLIGLNYVEAFIKMKEDYNTVLMGISRIENGIRKLIANPSNGEKILLNDYLLMMGDGQAQSRVQKSFGVEQGRIAED
jgi:voltage-gated potassium channel